VTACYDAEGSDDTYSAVRYCTSCGRMTMGTAWAAVESRSGWDCDECGTRYRAEAES